MTFVTRAFNDVGKAINRAFTLPGSGGPPPPAPTLTVSSNSSITTQQSTPNQPIKVKPNAGDDSLSGTPVGAGAAGIKLDPLGVRGRGAAGYTTILGK